MEKYLGNLQKLQAETVKRSSSFNQIFHFIPKQMLIYR